MQQRRRQALTLPMPLLVSACATAHFVIPPGDPLADPASVVIHDDARFTVLTPATIRLEHAGFHDNKTMVIFNRRLPAVPFNRSVLPNGTLVLETTALTLAYDVTPAAFEDRLRVWFRRPNLFNESRWTPRRPNTGNLYGTWRTYDTLSGFQNLNCTEQRGWTQTHEPSHCTMGLISRAGWATIDDARSPVLTDGWVRPQLLGGCPSPSSAAPCFGAGWQPFNNGSATPRTCEAAGCCWVGDAAAAASSTDGLANGTIVLNEYWSSSAADNVLATAAFAPAGYDLVAGSPVGALYATGAAPPGPTARVQLWRSPAGVAVDHWTSTSTSEEHAAAAANYSLVGTLGDLPGGGGGGVATVLYYSAERNDHFSSTNGCAGCGGAGYVKVEAQAALLAPAMASSCIQRSGNVDTYLFAHGVGREEYREALADFAQLAGPVALPRRHAAGVSWSRWADSWSHSNWSGNQSAMMGAVDALRDAGFPLDQFVLDMNWHEKPHWAGYSWDRQMYPDPPALLSFLHGRGLSVGANLHDAEGVLPFEDAYAAMAKANGIDPASDETVPFHPSSQRYADSLERLVLRPLVADGAGLDWWWTDWQQGLGGAPGVGTTDVTGLNPTMWLNHYRSMNYTAGGPTGVRPLIHSRFGGLGGHRYATQFGGDVKRDWPSLAAMIYTNAVSANALVAHWGQEVMQLPGEHQLFTRLIQFAAYSPVFTIWGNGAAPCNLWSDADFPQPYRAAAQAALAHRSMLLPYRWTLAVEARRTGLAMTRPMYYAWPWEAAAYSGRYSSLSQHMVGDALLVSPVHEPLSCGDSCASGTSPAMPLWLPGGDDRWLRLFGDSPPPDAPTNASGWTTVSAALAEVPVYARLGSALPMLRYADALAHGAASRPFARLDWWLLLWGRSTGSGAQRSATDDGAASCMEDDGISNAYLEAPGNDTSATMRVAWRLGAAGCIDFDLGATGTHADAPPAASRAYRLRLVDPPSVALTNVTIDGAAVARSATACAAEPDVAATAPEQPAWCVGEAARPHAAAPFVQITVGTVRAVAQHSVSVCGLEHDLHD
jgi:hypothetical protein